MNRALLKQDAKDAMSMANPHPVLTTLIFLVICTVAAFIPNIITGTFGITGAVLNSESVIMFGGLVSLLITIIIVLLLCAVQFGYIVYSLKVFKHEDTGINELFAYFPMLLKIIGLALWMGLFMWLWSCLCIIPGIIAGLRYSQAFFILAENPDKSIRECVNESKELMSGRLWEYFVLQLSFILWILLTCVTCGLAGLYVQPYKQITNAGYYLSLKPYDTYDSYNSGYQDGYADGYNAGNGYQTNNSYDNTQF